MKIFSKIALIVTLFSFLLSATSCVVLVPKTNHNNGLHKGWYKKPNYKSPAKKNGKRKHGQYKNISLVENINY